MALESSSCQRERGERERERGREGGREGGRECGERESRDRERERERVREEEGERERGREGEREGVRVRVLVLALTLSMRVYQWSVLSVRSKEERGSLTSPRNWFRPNRSQSHTLSHRVLDDSSDSVNLY